ncbi:membrane protein insertase YidC [Alteromonas sp. 5E99-2]|uniref:membrane protein insertase YidC n=1 Tax=Alteromonas sp. 5E99-2 TaxID=2817683 RepID=UPI001A9A24C2|nr:membrane protein insertase YidC [Alteromonas sp. 5E99-2]MBO1256787.1 membrane protein insertase YidC [Alteromonas sp. 5E99-2]
MESQRSFLIIGLALVSFMLWQQWQVDYGPQPIEPIAEQALLPESDTPSVSSTTSVDDSFVPEGDASTVKTTNIDATQRYVKVKTDVLDITIDLIGGDVVDALLIDFPISQDSDDPFILLQRDNGIHVAQSGLVGLNGPDASKDGRPKYQVQQLNFVLDENQNEITIPLTWESDTISVTKLFTIAKGSHDVKVNYDVLNKTSSPIQIQQYAQLKQTTDADDSSSLFMPTYKGAAYSTEDKRYKKYDFDDIADEDLRKSTPAGWVAMLQHYFVAAWVPPQTETNNLYTKQLRNGDAIIGFTGSPVNIAANDKVSISTLLYVGPKNQEHLKTLAHGLDLTVDYGPLWFISVYLFKLLNFLHGLVQNWGLAIILITVIVKGLMYPLTKKQYESMAKMRNLAPKMKQLNDRYGDDRQKKSQAMMELYKKEKVNPMGGCFPILLQMPIFLALYWALLESVELRHAGFLWITDLSVQDPYFIIPILTGLSMFFLQKLQPSTMTDPMQQKIMQFMPVAMSIFFFFFPAGLVLYWLVSNVITLVQAKIIYASMEKRGLK